MNPFEKLNEEAKSIPENDRAAQEAWRLKHESLERKMTRESHLKNMSVKDFWIKTLGTPSIEKDDAETDNGWNHDDSVYKSDEPLCHQLEVTPYKKGCCWTFKLRCTLDDVDIDLEICKTCKRKLII